MVASILLLARNSFRYLACFFILKKRAIEIVFLMTNILNLFGAIGVAVNIVAVVFNFKDENALLRNE